MMWTAGGAGDVTTSTTTEKQVATVRCQGIEASKEVIIFGNFSILATADSVLVTIAVREGVGIGGSIIEEARTQTIIATKQGILFIMVLATTTEDDEDYTLTVKVDGSNNATIHNGRIVVAELGRT